MILHKYPGGFPLILILPILFAGCSLSVSESEEEEKIESVVPVVTSTFPAPDSTDLPTDVVLSATFNHEMDPFTITPWTFLVNKDGERIFGGVSYSNLVAYFTSKNLLEYDTTYTATITQEARNLNGKALKDFSWSFTTQAQPKSITQYFGSQRDDWGLSVASGRSGEVYIAGMTDGDMYGNINAGDFDSFLVRSDASLNLEWTRQIGTPGDDRGYGVAVDANGGVYITGSTMGELPGFSNAGHDDYYLVKYDLSGAHQWTLQHGAHGTDRAFGVAVGADEGIYVAGSTGTGFDGMVHKGDMDTFLVKYDSDGGRQWTRLLGTYSKDEPQGVAAGPDGGIYMAGYTLGSLDGNSNIGADDSFLVKYDSLGVRAWTRQFGTTETDQASGVAADDTGSIYVVGHTKGDLDGNVNSGGEDLFLVKYDTAGNRQWTRQMGSPFDDQATGVAIDLDNSVYVVGWTLGNLGEIINPGYEDLFIIKYNSDGDFQWLRQTGQFSGDIALSVTVDSNGEIVVVGGSNANRDETGAYVGSDVYVLRFDSFGNQIKFQK